MNGLSERPLGEREVGIAYSAAAVLPLFFSLIFALIALAISPDYETEGWYTLGAYLCSQLAFLSVVAGVCAFTRQSPAKALGFCRCHVKFYLIGFVLVFGMLFGASILASLFETWMEELGFTLSGAPVPVDTAGYFAASLVVVGIIPGILEEALFRGVLLGGMKRFPPWAAVLLSGALFSLFHQNPAQTVYQFLFGCVFALVVIKSGSLLPAVFMHVLNNAFIIVYQYLGAEPGETASLVLLLAGLIAAIGGITCLLLCKTPPREERERPRYGVFFLYASLGILYCAAMWALTLAAV